MTQTMKSTLALAIVLSVSASYAQSPYGTGGPPPGFFPQGMLNVATRYETYCLGGVWPCRETLVREYGQTCHAPSPGGSPYLDNWIPPGFRYVSWRCVPMGPISDGLKTHS